MLYRGIERLGREGDSLQWGGESLGKDDFSNMPSGRARFTPVKLPGLTVPHGAFVLTMRRGKQFNSMTYGNADPMTGGSSRGQILMDPRDLKELGLSDGDSVNVSSEAASMVATVKAGPCRSRTVQGFWPECNVLLTPKYDPQSGEPDYTAIVAISRQ